MLKKQLHRFIENHQLLKKEDRLLLAVSGGGDSMAMLDIMTEEGFYCEVAHVNFQLRGEHSLRDAALVRQVSEAKDLVFHYKSIDTMAYAEKHKISMEMAAREIRYDFFEEILKECQLDYVVVAHHRDDVVETFFINLMRGTGLRGLSGILPKKDKIVRPLLNVSHQDIINYLETRNLDYCTDESNFDTTILRNQIRHGIIPDFEEKKQGFSEIMQRTIARLRESEAVVSAYVEDWKTKNMNRQGDVLLLNKKALYTSVSPSEILFHILQPLGFPIAVIDEVAAQPLMRVGARFETGKYRLTIDRDSLIIDQKGKEKGEFLIAPFSQKLERPMRMELFFFEREESFELIKDHKIAYLDADKLTYPLTLRRWQEGDVFCPIGMAGKQKKVSDYFIDNKFSLPEKENAWLLCSGDNIV